MAGIGPSDVLHESTRAIVERMTIGAGASSASLFLFSSRRLRVEDAVGTLCRGGQVFAQFPLIDATMLTTMNRSPAKPRAGTIVNSAEWTAAEIKYGMRSSVHGKFLVPRFRLHYARISRLGFDYSAG